jgi:deoxyribonucleoside regulator
LRSTKEALERDPVIASVLALAEKVSIACFTLGALSEESVHVESGHLTKRRDRRYPRALRQR